MSKKVNFGKWLVDSHLPSIPCWLTKSSEEQIFLHQQANTAMTLSNGCLNIAMFGLLATMPKTVWASLQDYIKQWVLPATWRMKHLHSLFSEKRLKKYKESQRIAVQASEALALAQIFVYFVHSIALPSGSCM